MDAVDFVKEKYRICNFYPKNCNKCPLGEINNNFQCGCSYLLEKHTEEYVKIVEKWSRWAMSNVFKNKNIVNQHLIDWVEQNNFNIHYFNDFSYVSCGKGNAKTVEILITNY